MRKFKIFLLNLVRDKRTVYKFVRFLKKGVYVDGAKFVPVSSYKEI